MKDEIHEDEKTLVVKRDDLGRWAPGSSGNPAGRPQNPASLNYLLNDVFEYEAITEQGIMTHKEWLSYAIREALTTGNMPFKNGGSMRIGSAELLVMLRWFYNRLEPESNRLDITSGGERIDFSGFSNDELENFVSSQIASTFAGTSGDGESGDSAEDTEPEDTPG